MKQIHKKGLGLLQNLSDDAWDGIAAVVLITIAVSCIVYGLSTIN